MDGDLNIILKEISIPGRVYKASALSTATSDTFIGFALSAITKGTAGNINITGIISGFSSLTLGGFYYLSDTYGAIATAHGTVTRKVGFAITATDFVITNIW